MNLPILIWAQPLSSAAKWKGRGVTGFYGYDNGGNVAKASWEAGLATAGMTFIDAPGPDLVGESKQPGRIGWCQPDEPDLVTHVNLSGSKIKDLATTYNGCHAAAPSMPVWVNLNGSSFDNVAYDGTPHPTKTDGSLAGHRAATGGYMAWADRIGFDYHLATTGRKGMFDITQRLLDRAHDWSGGKPIFAYVELCTQGSGIPYTADDFEAEVWNIVNYCAKKNYTLAGLCEFADQVIPKWTSYDMVADDVVARMIKVHAQLNPAPAPPVPPTPPVTPINKPTSVIIDGHKWMKAPMRKILTVQAIVVSSKYRITFDGTVTTNGTSVSSDGNPANDPFNVSDVPPDIGYAPVVNADGVSVDLPFGDGVGAGNVWQVGSIPWINEAVTSGTGKTV